DRAAVVLFAAHGIDGVSIADIAAAAQVSQGALYRHYRSKDALAAALFGAAYLRTGEDLRAVGAAAAGFAARITAMVTHFCARFDRDAALFRFLLIAQHDLLPGVAESGSTPVAAIEAVVEQAVAVGEVAAVEPALAAAAVMGVVLQAALFHIYGR